RNDLIYYDVTLGPQSPDGMMSLRATQRGWNNTIKLAYVADAQWFGATPSIALTVPITLDASLHVDVVQPALGTVLKEDGGGLGDVVISPMLFWKNGNHHFNVSPMIYA